MRQLTLPGISAKGADKVQVKLDYPPLSASA